MATERVKAVEADFKPILKAAGFRKKGRTWRRHLDDFIQVVNIQGSQWADDFYVNLGVFVKAIETNDCPAEWDCHLRIRLSELTDDRLDWQQFVVNLLETKGLPWLERCSTFTGARDEYHKERLGLPMTVKDICDDYFS